MMRLYRFSGRANVFRLLELDARDPLVSDARLGRRVRAFFEVYDAARSSRLSRPPNVVDLMAWLEESVARKRGISGPR
jgi:hypothetical protein